MEYISVAGKKRGFPGGIMVKNPPGIADTRVVGLIPGSGRSLGEGNGNSLQYSCLGDPMDRGAWWAAAHGVITVGHDLATKPYREGLHNSI